MNNEENDYSEIYNEIDNMKINYGKKIESLKNLMMNYST